MATQEKIEQATNDLLASMPEDYRAAFTTLMQDTARQLADAGHDYPARFPVAAPYPILPSEQDDPFLRKSWVVFALLINSGHLPIPDAGKRDISEALAHAVAIIREALYYCEYGKVE